MRAWTLRGKRLKILRWLKVLVKSLHGNGHALMLHKSDNLPVRSYGSMIGETSSAISGEIEDTGLSELAKHVHGF